MGDGTMRLLIKRTSSWQRTNVDPTIAKLLQEYHNIMYSVTDRFSNIYSKIAFVL